jgi:hypothetical protein
MREIGYFVSAAKQVIKKQTAKLFNNFCESLTHATA